MGRDPATVPTMIAVPRSRLVPITLLAVISVLNGCRTMPPIVVHEGPLADSDLTMAWAKAANRDAGSFSEQLRIDAVLDDGGEVSTKLTVTNIAKFDGRAEILAKVQLPGGESEVDDEDDDAEEAPATEAAATTVYRVKVKKDRGDWTAGKDRFDATIGDCTVVVGVGYAEVHAVGKDFVLDYRVESDVPALRPAGGLVNFGGAFYTTTLPVPRGRLTGTLVTRGPPEEEGGEPVEETIDLEGWAYVEHRATDLAPYRMAAKWFKMRELTTERTVVLSAFQRTAELGGGIQGFVMVASNDGLEAYEGEVELRLRDETLDADTTYGVPALVFLEGKDGPGFRGVIRLNTLTQRRDDIANLSTLERIVVKRLMKPFTYIFDGADYLFKVRESDATEDEIPWRGQTTFEFQQLNPE